LLPAFFTPRTSALERSHRPARLAGSISTFVGPPLPYTPVYRLCRIRQGTDKGSGFYRKAACMVENSHVWLEPLCIVLKCKLMIMTGGLPG
jgi:hypothetical protein